MKQTTKLANRLGERIMEYIREAGQYGAYPHLQALTQMIDEDFRKELALFAMKHGITISEAVDEK